MASDRLDAARRHGLPDALAERLVGSTPEELAADAAALVALRGPASTRMKSGHAAILRALDHLDPPDEPGYQEPIGGFDSGAARLPAAEPKSPADVEREHSDWLGGLLARKAAGL